MPKATVKIQLADEDIELVPTLEAMEYLHKQVDNFQAVYARLSTMNFDMYTHVIYAGVIGKKPNIKAIKENVFETGMIPLMEPLIRFTTILLNGGKEPKEAEEAKSTNPEAF